MVSRLFGKLDAQRQRTSGSAGVCATACAAAAVEITPNPARERNFLRFTEPPGVKVFRLLREESGSRRPGYWGQVVWVKLGGYRQASKGVACKERAYPWVQGR